MKRTSAYVLLVLCVLLALANGSDARRAGTPQGAAAGARPAPAAGSLRAASTGMTVIEPATVVVSEVKKAESGDDLVIRLYETDGTRGTASVEFDRAIIGAVDGVAETDLLERPLQKGTARVKGNGFVVDVPAYGIATVRLRLSARK